MIFNRLQQQSTSPLIDTSKATTPATANTILARIRNQTPKLFVRSFFPSSSLPSPSPSTREKEHEGQQGLLLETALSTNEVNKIMRRRLMNLSLPDDIHTSLSETISTFIQTSTSLFAKLHILNLPVVNNFLNEHSYITWIVLSQLYPLRILQIPLFKLFRPLQWILTPFASFSTPLALRLTVQRSLEYIFPPARHISSNSRSSRAGRGNVNIRRPRAVDDVIKNVRNWSDRAVERLHQFREQTNQSIQSALPPAPHLFITTQRKPTVEGKERRSTVNEEETEIERRNNDQVKEEEKVVTLGAKGLAAIRHEKEKRAKGIALYEYEHINSNSTGNSSILDSNNNNNIKITDGISRK